MVGFVGIKEMSARTVVMQFLCFLKLFLISRLPLCMLVCFVLDTVMNFVSNMSNAI